MAIDFPCPRCRVPQTRAEHTAGQPGRCEACDASWVIPFRSQPLPAVTNPYAAPLEGPFTSPTEPLLPIRPSEIDIHDVWLRSWSIYQRALGPLIAMTGAYLLLMMTLIGGMIAVETFLNELGWDDFTRQAAGFAFVPFVTAAELFLNIGWMRVMLDVARGRPPDYARLFDARDVIGRVYLLSLLFAVAGRSWELFSNWLSLGVEPFSLAIQTPYFVLLLAFEVVFGPYLVLAIDRGLSLRQSLATSRAITRGNRGAIFVLLVFGGLVILAGALFCGVGVILTLSLASLLQVVTYLRMTGEEPA